MKISNSQMFRKFRNWYLAAITLVIAAGTTTSYAQDGEALFKSKCNTCHMIDKNSTGPALKGAKKRWEDAGEGDLIYDWVHNSATLIASGKSKRAGEVKTFSPTDMPPQTVTNEEIDAILNYVDTYEPPVADAGAATGAAGAATGAVATEEPASTGWIWIVLAVIFITVIVSVGGVRRQLKFAAAEAAGEEYDENQTYSDELKGWAWKNKRYVGVGVLVVVLALLVALFQSLYRIGVVEDYQPSQPIAFPHSVHAGTNGIDCKYCHNSVTKSRTAGIPTVNVCMNCHKQISGRTPAQQEQITKIYEAAGWDATKGAYTGKTKPIVWNKVHVLPDHVYFNHSQHVVVGGVDCKQCHGDMAKMTETAKVQPISELNKVEGNIQLTKPTLTMGWCIECHDQKEISTGQIIDTKKDGYYEEIHKRLLKNDPELYKNYLKDGKVTVKELGGWECAKCHY